MKDIHIGFEIGSGKPVGVPLSHVIVTGLTQLSGKTTTLEALITRSGLKAIVFKTKPGERGFNAGTPCPPYFKEHSDWQYVSSLLEATLKEKMRFERSWIMTACKGTSSLLQVKKNIEEQLANPRLGSLHRSVYTTLDEYFNLILPQLSVTSFSNVLELQPGVNIMDLQRLKDELQNLVMRSVMETVLHEMHDVIVVIPEAWKFLPQGTGSPCKLAAEQFIRQGGTNRNFLWVDSQDMAGVDKTPLKQVSTWILGLQSERNEVKHTIDQMPIPKKHRPAEDEIMTLQKGHFYVCTPRFSRKVYVQPAWLDDETAALVADGTMNVDEVQKPVGASQPFRTIEDFSRQLAEIRKDFTRQIDELTKYVSKISGVVTDLSMNHSRGVTTKPVDINGVVTEVMNKLPNMELLKTQILDEVMKKIPAGGRSAGGTIVVEPLAALKKKFLAEARDRLLAQVAGIPSDAKKVIQFVETIEKGVSQKDLLDKCLGISGTSGGNNAKAKKLTQELSALGLVRRDDRKAITYPNLREKIKQELSMQGATEEEMGAVYNHIIAGMLDGKTE